MTSHNPKTASNIREYVRDVQGKYTQIEHEAWDPNTNRYSKSHTEMWIEASQIVPEQEWREIIRVLAQGGEYYSIEWPTNDPIGNARAKSIREIF